jgi:hypothetical protein
MKKGTTKKDAKKAVVLSDATIKDMMKDQEEIVEIVASAMPEKTIAEKQIEMLFSILDNQQFAMPFFSQALYEALIVSGKAKNLASAQRMSGYESLPYIFPYDEKFKEKGFSGSRGRMFASCVLGLTADQIITFDMYNRKLEGTQEKKKNVHRKLLAISKAYFPLLHDNRKTLYPIEKFK